MPFNHTLFQKGMFEMAFSKEQIEYLHNIGKMSDWYYYQVNGNTAEQNYVLQQNNRLYKRKMQKDIEKELNNIIGDLLNSLLENESKDFDVKLIL